MTVRWPILAVDIGGTKTAAALVQPDGTIENLCLAPTQGEDSTAESIGRTVIDTTRRACSGYVPSHIGIACAGPIDPTRGTVRPVNIAAWALDYPLLRAFERAFPEATSSLVGDAGAAALGEYRFGVGRAVSCLLGIVVSTGVGGGLVLGGSLYQGPGGNAGHVGHMAAGSEFAAEACRCGATGCVEAVASGPALEAWAWAQAPDREKLSSGQLAAAARDGDPIATQAYHRAARALAHTIVQTSLVCELEVVVIGGGVAQAGDVLLDPLRACIEATPGLAFAEGGGGSGACTAA